jgi:hypothetical protein
MTITEILAAFTAAGLDACEAWCDEVPVTSVDLTVATGVVLRVAGPDYVRAEVMALRGDGIIDVGDPRDPEVDTATTTPTGNGPTAVAEAWAAWRAQFLTEFTTPWAYLDFTEEAYLDLVGSDYDWPAPTGPTGGTRG